MGLLDTLSHYGWIGIAVFIIVDKIWPRVFKQYSRQRDQGMELQLQQVSFQQQQAMTNAQAEREEREADRKYRQEREEANRKFRQEIDEREARAMEKLADSYTAMIGLQTSMNERMNAFQNGQIESMRNQADIIKLVNESTTFMSEIVATLRPERIGKQPQPRERGKGDAPGEMRA